MVMEILSGEKPKYEIVELVDQGLTGCIYKAFRRDSRNQTQQLVALKIIKSKSDVQILRQEFFRLRKLNSTYCVRLLGWENFKKGPALVLEYLEGSNLQQFMKYGPLTKLLVDEICAQVQIGLKDLSTFGVFHGDLNPKNIFITRRGAVKLVDFGSQHQRSGKRIASPLYMAPELWLGAEPDYRSDLFSLGIIRHQLLNNPSPVESSLKELHNRLLDSNDLLKADAGKRIPLDLQTRKIRRRKLAQEVIRRKNLVESCGKTQRISTSRSPSQRQGRRGLSFALSFALLLFLSAKKESAFFEGGTLDLRTRTWAQVSVNQLPDQFAPIYIDKLRPGKYSILHRGASLQSHHIELQDRELFLLQLDQRPL